MEKLVNYKDICDLSNGIWDIINGNSSDYNDVLSLCVVGNFDIISKLLKEFICMDLDDEYIIGDINLESPELDNYEREYYFEIDINDKNIWISKAYNGKLYVMTFCDLLIMDNKSDKEILHSIGFEDKIFFSFGENEKDTLDKTSVSSCEMYHNSLTGIHGFSITGNNEKGSWSKSFYSKDIDLVYKMLEEWK